MLFSFAFKLPPGAFGRLFIRLMMFVTCWDALFTWTLKLPLVEFPAASVAVQLTVVSPIGKNEPDAGAHETVGVERLSLAGGAELAFAPAGLVALAVTCERAEG